jgi:MFS family permease
VCGRLLKRYAARPVIAASAAAAAAGALVYALAGTSGLLLLGTPVFGIGIGIATTAAYTAASSVMPGTARGAGFGLLTTASLAGLALSPIVNGMLAATSIRAVFVLDAVALVVMAALVSRLMIAARVEGAASPAIEEV